KRAGSPRSTVVAANGGEVYLVGEGRGWTSIGHIDYKTWLLPSIFKLVTPLQPGHCKSGQKVDIRVLPPAPPVVTLAVMEPLPFPYPQPHIPSPAPVKSLSNPAPSPTPATPAPPPTHVTSAPAPTHVTPSPAPTHVTLSPAHSPVTPLPAPSPAPAAPTTAPSTPEDIPDADAAPQEAAKSHAKQLETTS
nr:hypothetical protein [Tanacetum cinerariifolium]